MDAVSLVRTARTVGTAAPYEWKPLNNSKCEIRLMRILPVDTGDNDLLHLSLRTVSLAEAGGDYDAISYTWGPATDLHEIRIDGKAAWIRDNIWRFFMHCRDTAFYDKHHTNLWVDSICIDQSNLEEKNCQVRLIKDVFSTARQVIVWLGEASARNSLAQIVQELLVAQSPCFVCGTQLMNVDGLLKNRYPSGQQDLHLRILECRSAFQKNSLSLTQVVNAMDEQKCENSLDHVFGLLRLVENGQELQIDYSLSVYDLLQRATEFAQAHDRSPLINSIFHFEALAGSLGLDYKSPDLQTGSDLNVPEYHLTFEVTAYFTPRTRDDCQCVDYRMIDNASQTECQLTRHSLAYDISERKECITGHAFCEAILQAHLTSEFSLLVNKTEILLAWVDNSAHPACVMPDPEAGLVRPHFKRRSYAPEKMNTKPTLHTELLPPELRQDLKPFAFILEDPEEVRSKHRSRAPEEMPTKLTLRTKPLPSELRQDLTPSAFFREFDRGKMSQGLTQTIRMPCSFLTMVELCNNKYNKGMWPGV
ncbi:hypothetical protein LTR17_020902 [Elasticomyces elasticus]|nr:hypothetical protein LTR17_020902 [Elasticomyces elasticus]